MTTWPMNWHMLVARLEVGKDNETPSLSKQTKNPRIPALHVPLGYVPLVILL
jgi:hypothetical protein